MKNEKKRKKEKCWPSSHLLCSFMSMLFWYLHHHNFHHHRQQQRPRYQYTGNIILFFIFFTLSNINTRSTTFLHVKRLSTSSYVMHINVLIWLIHSRTHFIWSTKRPRDRQTDRQREERGREKKFILHYFITYFTRQPLKICMPIDTQATRVLIWSDL